MNLVGDALGNSRVAGHWCQAKYSRGTTYSQHVDIRHCKNVAGFWHQLPVKYLITTRPIKAGEELTAKYTLYHDFDDKSL